MRADKPASSSGDGLDLSVPRFHQIQIAHQLARDFFRDVAMPGERVDAFALGVHAGKAQRTLGVVAEAHFGRVHAQRAVAAQPLDFDPVARRRGPEALDRFGAARPIAVERADVDREALGLPDDVLEEPAPLGAHELDRAAGDADVDLADDDAAQARGDALGPLHGVPVTTKVNTDQKGHPTDNGVEAFRDNIASEDAPLVKNFRRAGAIIVGRTNTPAFSFRWFTENDLHGRTLNPWSAAHTPGRRESDSLSCAPGPLRARGPATLALSCEGGRWMPRPLGPSRYTPA